MYGFANLLSNHPLKATSSISAAKLTPLTVYFTGHDSKGNTVKRSLNQSQRNVIEEESSTHQPTLQRTSSMSVVNSNVRVGEPKKVVYSIISDASSANRKQAARPHIKLVVNKSSTLVNEAYNDDLNDVLLVPSSPNHATTPLAHTAAFATPTSQKDYGGAHQHHASSPEAQIYIDGDG